MAEKKPGTGTRREFVKKAGRIAMAAPVLALPIILSRKADAKGYVWQIDPYKCTFCEQCRTLCVMTPSAVKCTNAFQMCGYCDFCPGFLRQGAKKYSTAAEDQLCPTGAIKRRFVEEPYFEYTIDEKLCDGCSKCVKGCYDFGNGSLYLQIMHNLCLNCNQCAIARGCPSDAVVRVSATEAYVRKEQKGTPKVVPLAVMRARKKQEKIFNGKYLLDGERLSC